MSTQKAPRDLKCIGAFGSLTTTPTRPAIAHRSKTMICRVPIRVVHLQRRPIAGLHYSMENVFSEVRGEMPVDIDASVATCPSPSRGITNRLRNMAFTQRAAAKCDVLHITGDVHYVGLLVPRRQCVLTIHDCGGLRELRGIKRFLLRKLWFEWPMQWVHEVSVVSSATKDELRRLVPGVRADRITVVPNPVGREFEVWPKEFDERSPRVLQVGTKENKNILRLCEALRGIACSVRVIGPLHEKQAAAFNENRIDYTSGEQLSRGEIVEEYRRADIVAVASTYEGFGLPVIEAQATGRVVIAADIGGIREVAGRGACWVDPLDVESIRRGFGEVIGNSGYRRELVREGLENVKRFGAREIAGRYADIYRRVQPK